MIAETELPLTPHDLANMHVLVWGIGQYGGGLASARFCTQHGARVSLIDQKDPSSFPEAQELAQEHRWEIYQGDIEHRIFIDADLIIISPAIPPRVINNFQDKMCTDLILFLHWQRGHCIGITGTKGKSSCAHLLHQITKIPVIGNSNTPVLTHAAKHGFDTDVIIECSSFQLWYLQSFHFTFSIGIITNIDRDHLDWHESLEDYQASKHWLCLHSTNVITQDETIQQSYAQRSIYDKELIDPHLNKYEFAAHQKLNLGLAIQAALHIGIHINDIIDRINTISFLPHRLEVVHRCNETVFINDSAATTPIALLAALQFIDGPKVFIIGGHDKGGDFSKVAAYIKSANIPCVLLGEAAATLIKQDIHGPICENLESAIETAVQGLDPTQGGSVVLSPGCASFGQFSNYIERGQAFVAFAKKRWPA